jgi:hypothetical protein
MTTQNVTASSASLFASLVETAPADLGSLSDLAASLLAVADQADADGFATQQAKARLAEAQAAPQGTGNAGTAGAFADYQAKLASAHGRLDARIRMLGDLSAAARQEAETYRLIAATLPVPLALEPSSASPAALAIQEAINDASDEAARQSDEAARASQEPSSASPAALAIQEAINDASDIAARQSDEAARASQEETLTAQAALPPQDEAAPHSPLSPVMPGADETTTYNGVEIPVILTREAAQEMDAAQLKVYAQAHGVPYKANASKARMMTALGF